MSDNAPVDPDEVVVRATDPASLTDGQLVRLLSELEATGRRVDAARVRLAGEVAHRSRRELGPERLSARLGCRNANEVVQRTTGVSGAAVARRIRLGSATRGGIGLSGADVPARFASVADALAAGDLGVDAAHAIVTTLEPTLRVARASDVAAGERALVDAATETWASRADGDAGVDGDAGAHDEAGAEDGARADGEPAAGDSTRTGACPVLDADDVRLQARVWAEFLDPDGTAPDDRDEERRFLALHAPRHGLVPVSGLLLPQVAAALTTYADAWTNPKTVPVPDPTRTTAAGPGGAPVEEPADEPTDSRSRAQVLHDVLATALNVAARAVDAPSVAGNAPTLVVVARQEDLTAPDAVACTEGGTPVNIAVARHIGCAGAIQRITVDGDGRVVGLWSANRCFTGVQRRAIAIRDGGCVIPGCHVPAAWCEVHHVVPHADDPGGTHTDNGVLLCWHHHRTIDTSGWQVRMLDGLPWVRPPSWLDRAGRWRAAGARAARRSA